VLEDDPGRDTMPGVLDPLGQSQSQSQGSQSQSQRQG
jgi:hypothetical protein